MQTTGILRCRACGSAVEHTFVDLGMVPLCQSYVAREQLDRGEMFYPLRAYLCATCYYVGLPEYVSAKDIFTEYAYFSSYSDSWMSYIEQSVDSMVQQFGLGPSSQVVEMGSNDGYLLQHFIAKGIPAIGVEPAANVAKVAQEKGVPTIPRFFDTATARLLCGQGKSADLLLAYNCLDHVPGLVDCIAGMKLVLKPDGVVQIELPHLRSLIEGNQFDTIYHDRYSYFSFTSLHRMFRSQALEIVDVKEIPTHGGSLRVLACHAGRAGLAISPNVSAMLEAEAQAGLKSLAYYSQFAQRVMATKHKLLEFLIDARREGKKVVGYGVPAKGNVMLNCCGIRGDFVDYLVDRSPYKCGKFAPGSRLEIRDVDQIGVTQPDYLLILPWNIKEEIIGQMAGIRAWGGRFVVAVPRLEVL